MNNNLKHFDDEVNLRDMFHFKVPNLPDIMIQQIILVVKNNGAC